MLFTGRDAEAGARLKALATGSGFLQINMLEADAGIKTAEAASALGDAGVRHLNDFFALREGRFTEFHLSKMEGIITFPSFHCVLAVLTAWALWPLRWLGPLAAAFNALVLVSTIPQGGHYLADILSGMAIGLAVLALHYASAARRAVPQPATA